MRWIPIDDIQIDDIPKGRVALTDGQTLTMGEHVGMWGGHLFRNDARIEPTHYAIIELPAVELEPA